MNQYVPKSYGLQTRPNSPDNEVNDARLTAIFHDNPHRPVSAVSILGFTGAKDDGAGDCSYETCKAPVKSSPPVS